MRYMHTTRPHIENTREKHRKDGTRKFLTKSSLQLPSQPARCTQKRNLLLPRSTPTQDLAGQVQYYRNMNMAGPNGICVGFHVPGGR
jgi:hypothetical protein